MKCDGKSPPFLVSFSHSFIFVFFCVCVQGVDEEEAVEEHEVQQRETEKEF
jgi:hypothetical protein